MEQSSSKLVSSLDEVRKFFGEKPIDLKAADCQCQEFFTLLVKFASMYKKADEENIASILKVSYRALDYYIYYVMEFMM
jgi:hypothetical protein